MYYISECFLVFVCLSVQLLSQVRHHRGLPRGWYVPSHHAYTMWTHDILQAPLYSRLIIYVMLSVFVLVAVLYLLPRYYRLFWYRDYNNTGR